MISAPVKSNRKFKEPACYLNTNESYYLLPFRFHRLNEQKEVIVNECGDFLIIPAGTTRKIVSKQLTSNDDIYPDLIANFFISEEPVPELLNVIAAKYRTKKSFLDHFTALHIFVITLRCEHTCHYCQVSRVSDNRVAYDMQASHIDKGIDMMMRSPNPHVTMEFQGGEALLAFDSIVYAVKKATDEAIRHDKKITFVICSNLALITGEILSFCKAHEILLSTSIDGPDFLHNNNRHRKGNNSYELAVNGINKSREVLGKENVSALLTTSTYSLNFPIEIVDEYFSLGFRNIFLRPISPYGFALKNENKNSYPVRDFLAFYKKALTHIIGYNRRGEFYREDYATIILKKILTPFTVGYVDLQSPAGMINNVIVFNYDGDVYASDESRMLAQMKDYTFRLGSLETDSYEEIFYGRKTREFSAAWLNESLPGCSDCAFQAFCGSDPVFNYATQGDIMGHRPTSAFCERNMEIIRYLFELMDSDKDIERIFRSWIKS